MNLYLSWEQIFDPLLINHQKNANKLFPWSISVSIDVMHANNKPEETEVILTIFDWKKGKIWDV